MEKVLEKVNWGSENDETPRSRSKRVRKGKGKQKRRKKWKEGMKEKYETNA